MTPRVGLAEKIHPQGDTCDLSDKEVPDMPKAGGARGRGQSHVFPEPTGGVAGRGAPRGKPAFWAPQNHPLEGPP